MIRYLISFLILILSLKLSKKYVDTLKAELDLSRELVDFVVYIDEHIRLSMAPLSILVKHYSSKLLSECGFLDAVKNGENPRAVFSACIRKDGLDSVLCENLEELFSKMGQGDIASESERISAYRKALAARLDAIKDNYKKQKKIITTLSLGFALGFIILLL